MDDFLVEREGNSWVMKYGPTMDVYSVQVDNSLFTGRIWDYFNVGPMIHGSPENVLVLGLGGGTIVKQFLELFPSHIDVVEINPKVVELAAEHFNIRENSRLRIVISDALEFMEESERRYDVVIVDVFNGDVIPEKFTRPDFMRLLAERLHERGVAVVNTITTGRLLLTSDLMFENALKNFPSVFALDDEGNRLVVALKFKTDLDYVLKQVYSCTNPLLEFLKPKIKSRIKQR